MSRFNASFEFKKKKRLSVPMVEIPKSIKDFLNIDVVYPDGIFKIEPGNGICMYDRCYIFEDINYVKKDSGKKNTVLLELNRLFHSMDNQIKWTIASEKRDMEAFMNEVFQPVHAEDYPDIGEGIGSWISQKIEEGPRDIRKIMYLTVTCFAGGYEEAKAFFVSLETVLEDIFGLLESRLYRMSGLERLAVLQRMLRLGGMGIAPQAYHLLHDGWKNQILPARLEQEEDGIRINEKYACVLFGHDYDQSVNEETLIYSLTEKGFPVYVTADFEIVRRRLAKDKLKASHANNERNIELEKINQKSSASASVSYGKQIQKETLEKLMKQLEENDEEGVFVGLLVMVYADSAKELQDRVDSVCRTALSNYYTLTPYYNRQFDALSTILPIGGRRVNCMRFLFSSSAVAFQPFHASELMHDSGSIMGIDRTTKSLLRVDRKKLSAPHGMIVSHTGSGKSFFVKIVELAQTLLFTDDNITIIDPNNELMAFIKEHGGQYFDFTAGSSIRYNPYEVPLSVWEGDAIVKDRFTASKTEFSGRFFAAAMERDVTRVAITYVEEATEKIYEEYFSGGDFRKQPTLTKIWEELERQREQSQEELERKLLFDITKCTKAYVHGVYDMFAGESNLDVSKRLVGFGLVNVKGAPKKVILLTMMHIIGQRIENNQGDMKAERLIVDEAQALCEDEYISGEFLYAVETYRKVGAIVTIIVQNLKYVLENNDLCNIFSNCPYKVFFDQGGVDAAELSKIQELSEKEMRALTENRPGYGVCVCEGNVHLFDSRMDKENVLYQQFNTNFHEKAQGGDSICQQT